MARDMARPHPRLLLPFQVDRRSRGSAVHAKIICRRRGDPGADSAAGADIGSRNRHDWARRVAEAVMTGGTQQDPAQTHVLTGADH